MTTAAEVLTAALALSERERAHVAHQLLRSLDPPDVVNGDDDDDVESDPEFLAEIERRRQEIREGKAVLVDWDEAVDEIRNSLRSRQP